MRDLNSIVESLEEFLGEFRDKVIEWRRYLHQHPCLSGEEDKVVEYIHAELDKYLDVDGDSYWKPIRQSLVVKIGSGDGAMGLRADLDALPIQERTGWEYASRVPGVMHACGHDVHTAGLMGALVFLSRIHSKLPISVVGIFQHSEEKAPGGAHELIKLGLIKKFNIKAMIGVHVDPELSAGYLGYRAGPFMASADEFKVWFRGSGGHATQPHRASGDCLRACVNFYVLLDQLSKSWMSPLEKRLIHVGRMVAGEAQNIVAAEAFLHGTIRLFNEELRGKVVKNIISLAKYVGEVNGVEVEVEVPQGYPVLVCDERLTRVLADFLNSYGRFSGKVVPVPERMGSDDFAWYTKVVKGTYWRVGVATEDERSKKPLHNPEFLPPDESVLDVVRFFVMAVIGLVGVSV